MHTIFQVQECVFEIPFRSAAGTSRRKKGEGGTRRDGSARCSVVRAEPIVVFQKYVPVPEIISILNTPPEPEFPESLN